MKLENYISDLLYRYECVIVPDFGGFITSEFGSKINYNNHHFYPPYKKLGFNAYLKNNDGLLVNYIASVDQISFEAAATWLKETVLIWNDKIEKGDLFLSKIGTFQLNTEGKLQFEPNLVENYLTSSFGLSMVISETIDREVLQVVQKKVFVKPLAVVEKTVEITPSIAAITKPETATIQLPKRPNPVLRTLTVATKYAAMATIAVTLFGLGNNYYQQKLQDEFIAATQLHQEKTVQNIQEATFIISNPLPTITLNIEKETKNFHVIAGAFRNVENAERKVNELKQMGYDAHIISTNKWNLTQVAYESFSSMEEATKALTQILNKVDEEAWVLVTKN
ncbi:MAG: SPOR domain-containing protein [Flavobacteriaceae bacterium]|nr:SPOR domain-containing protein [Flavobacteriaceae bacterium]